MGHIARDCPSKRAYVATDDGGYVSASDEENEFVLSITMMHVMTLRIALK